MCFIWDGMKGTGSVSLRLLFLPSTWVLISLGQQDTWTTGVQPTPCKSFTRKHSQTDDKVDPTLSRDFQRE